MQFIQQQRGCSAKCWLTTELTLPPRPGNKQVSKTWGGSKCQGEKNKARRVRDITQTSKMLCLVKRSQTQENLQYCRIPFIWNVQNRQPYRDRKQTSSCQGLWGSRNENDCSGVARFRGDENIRKLIVVMVLQLREYIPPPHRTLSRGVLWYMD